MAMTKEDNDLLTDVAPNSPMGKLLRQYWAPVLRADTVVADGAPLRVTLYGDNYAVFRATDGSVGLVDEACPHRQVSMLLARNEENGLRCIFHGWKFDTSGAVVDAPCEPEARRARFCSQIKVNRYKVREAAGVIWAYVGGGEPPPFPDFDFNNLPPSRVVIRRAVVPYNWIQGVEAHVDSSHVAFLHRGFLTKNKSRLGARAANLVDMMEDTAPRFEFDETNYGLREAALRRQKDGQIYARIREIVLPFYTFIPGPDGGPYGGRVSVPIDSTSSAEWYILYSPHRDLSEAEIKTLFAGTSSDPDNFAANMGKAEDVWGQDRAAMRDGHFSGITQNLPFEDFVVQASMGSRVDRTKEQLGAADAIVVRVRRMLLEAAKATSTVAEARWKSGFSYAGIQARSAYFEDGKSWRDFASKQPA